VIVTSEGASREGLVEELQTFCREQTAPYKYPRIIDFVDALPKTATGKVARSKLKKPEA
jgi:acyl-coenzyme A synthetase/AMP-(fatty) acid ligase